MSESTTISPATTTRTIDDNASEILEQRRASQRYMVNNYYEEFAEIYRNLKARVEPFMVKQPDGTEVEDTSRSNFCLPDHFVMLRHGKARLTRNAPTLRLRGKDQDKANKGALLLMYQWDRAESQRSFRKIVLNAKAFGIGYGKSYYDKVVVTREFRRLTGNLDRESLMRVQGAPEDEIQQAVDQLGPTLSDNEIAQATAQHGNQVTVPTDVTKYEGAKLDYVFCGDLNLEPGFRSLNESAYQIENQIRDEQWLDYWTRQVSIDPQTGEEKPVIDPKKAQELLEIAGDRQYIDEKDISLRRMMREAIEVADPRTAGKPLKPPRKRFMLDERHSIVDGRLCIEYVGEESLYLGKMWYPWNTYGKSVYTDMVLIPDMIEGIGDSTLRISRFLMQLRNARANQTTDFINNKLLPLLKYIGNGNLTDESVIRTAFARLLKLKNMGEVEFLQDPEFPNEAWQDMASYIREMQQTEPAMNDFQPGTEEIPQSGKLATTAILQKQGADSVLADELNELGQFIRDTMEIHLYFNQQAMEDAVDVDPKTLPRAKSIVEALSLDTQGSNPRTIRIDPMDIQEEFEILPEEGSTLAQDDQYRTGRLLQGLQIALSAPQVFNVQTFAKAWLQSMPGISPEEGLAKPQPPPPPQPKISFAISAKFEELAGDVQAAILGEAGLPTEGTTALSGIQHTADVVEHVGRAAHAAADLESPAQPPPDADGKTPTPKGMKGMTGG